ANSNTADVTTPATVTIPAGQASFSFFIGANDNAIVDGSRNATLTASASGLANGSTTVTVIDDDTPTLTVTLDTSAVTEGGTATATVTRNQVTADPLTVTLSYLSNYPLNPQL